MSASKAKDKKKDQRRGQAKKPKIRLTDCLLPPGHPEAGAK